MKEALELLLQMAEAHFYHRVQFTDEDWMAAFDKAHAALDMHPDIHSLGNETP